MRVEPLFLLLRSRLPAGSAPDANGEIALPSSDVQALADLIAAGGEPVNASLSVGTDGSVGLFDGFALDVSDAEGEIFLLTRVEDGAGNTSYSMALSDHAASPQNQPLVVDLTDAVIGTDMSLAADTDTAGTADDLIINTGAPGTITFSADEAIASARVVQLEPFDVGGSSDGSDGGSAMAVYAGADITGVTVDVNKFYALDEASYELIEVEYTSDVAGVPNYDIVESGGTIDLIDSSGVADFKNANSTSVGIVPSDGSDGVPNTEPAESAGMGSMEPVSYELTTPAATANPNEYTASLEALSDGTTPVLSDGIWGLELTDLAGNVTLADLDPSNFVYDVATDLAADTDGVFIVDMSADTGDVAKVEMKRGDVVTDSISSIGSRDVRLDIEGLDEDVSSVTITITSEADKTLSDGVTTVTPSISADLSYDGSAGVTSVTGTWLSADAAAFVHNADVTSDVPSFIVNLAGTSSDEGLSNGAFDIEMTFTDIAGNTGAMMPVTKEIDNSADVEGDLGLAVDDEALGGISLEESTDFHVELVGRDSDVLEATVYALKPSEIEAQLVEIDAGFVAAGAQFDGTLLRDEVVDGAITYQYAVFKDTDGNKGYLNISEATAAGLLNGQGTNGEGARFATTTYSVAARNGIRLEEVGGVDSNGAPTFDLKIAGLTADNYDAASDALVLTVEAVDASGAAVSITPITLPAGSAPDANGEIAIDLSASTELTDLITAGGEPVNASLSVGTDGSVELFDGFALDVSDAEGEIFLLTRVEDGAGNTSYSMALSDHAASPQHQPLVVDLTDAVIGTDMSLAADTGAAGTADDLIINTGAPGTITFSADEAIASARVVQLEPFDVGGSYDGSDGSDGGLAVYAGADITGVAGVDAGKFYALDEANYALIEVTHTSDVDGVAHYEIVEMEVQLI